MVIEGSVFADLRINLWWTHDDVLARLEGRVFEVEMAGTVPPRHEGDAH